jgi:hypothetical protein
MVLVGELFCENLEHADFNRALVLTIEKAFKDEKVCFAASHGHVDCIRPLLQLSNSNIEFVRFTIPDKKKTSNIKRAIPDLINSLKLLIMAKKRGDKLLIISTINSQILVSLKIFLYFFPSVRCFCIPHDIILSLIENKKRPLKERIFDFSKALRLNSPGNLKLMTIGSITRDWLSEQMPKIKQDICSVPMAYVFERKGDDRKIDEKEIVFGYFGVATEKKGCQDFYRLALELKEIKTVKRARFIQIGQMGKKEIPPEIKNIIEIPSPFEPLSKEMYDLYGEKIDYAMIFYNRQYYDILHGASIMDALNYGKPVIAYPTKFINNLFYNLGDIGYICDDYLKTKDLVLRILNGNEHENYTRQVTTIMNSKIQFSPESLSKTYRDCLMS